MVNGGQIVDDENKVVMIVDDDVMMMRMAEALLNKGTPYKILKANSAMQCLRYLQGGEKVDLILLDIQMPGMDGIKTMELIQKHDYWNKIPVIFLTASSDRETVIKAGKLRPAGYIKKPFQEDELVERVITVMELGAI